MSNEDPNRIRSVEELMGVKEEDTAPLHLVLLGSSMRVINALIRAANIGSDSPTKDSDEIIRAKLLKPLEGLTGEERSHASQRVIEAELTRREVVRVNEIFHEVLSLEDIEILGMSAADLGGMVKGRDMPGIAESERRFKRDNFEAFNDFNSAIELAGGVPDEYYIHTGGQNPPPQS